MPFASYEVQIQPTALQGPYGRAWNRAHGLVKDFLANQARQAVRYRFPSYAPLDALGALGDERQIARGASAQLGALESDASYAPRVRAAWDAWFYGGTPLGMLQAFLAQGYSPQLIQQNGLAFSLDGGGNLVTTPGAAVGWPLWSTFLVRFNTPPSSWTSISNPPTSGSAPNINELKLLRSIIRAWKPAHTFCAGIQVVTSGLTWGQTGLKWGATGAHWGGTSVTFPATDVITWGFPTTQTWGSGLAWGNPT